MEDLFFAAINKESNPEYEFLIQGDLRQKSEQKEALLLWGFDVKQNDVYPSIKKSDVQKALKLIWEFKIDGWWHYSSMYFEFGFCTEDEFQREYIKDCKSEFDRKWWNK